MEKLTSTVFSAFVLIFLTYIGLSIIPSEFLPTADRERIISGNLASVAAQLWSFAKPLLQLAFIVLILEYVYTKFFGKALPLTVPQLSDVKSLIALTVVAAFAVAALAGSETAHLLKDVALVVIGFYFGAKKENA